MIEADDPGLSCPSVEYLEMFLDGADDRLVSDHVSTCGVCQQTLKAIREDDAFLDRHRRAFNTASESATNEYPRIRGYRIVSRFEEGGQGVIYKAIQLATKREVAVKLLVNGAFATARQRGRFEREIELIAGLRHPNIVTIFDSGTTADGRLYYAMEYVNGAPLDEYFGKNKPRSGIHSTADLSPSRPTHPPEQTLSLFCTICEAVNYAHQRGIVHRDLKPGNILVDSKGEPRILDFGLAKVSGIDALPGRTVSIAGEFMGTFAYASPEQAAGDPDLIDIRTDVYSLGVILYELLTGQHPYPSGNSVAEAIRNITEAEAASPSTINANVDDELDTITRKALAKHPGRRYQSAGDLLADIQRYRSGEAIDAKRDSTWYVLRKSVRRHRAAVLFAATAIVGLLAFSVIVSLEYRRALSAEKAEAQRSGELADSLHASNIERGRLMVYNGNVAVGERLLWREFLTNAPDSLCGRQAHWALRELYSQQPCLATLVTGSPDRKRLILRFLDLHSIAMYGDGSIATWNLRTLTRTAEEDVPGLEPIRLVGNPVSADGRFVVTGRRDRVLIWDRLNSRPPCPMEVTTLPGLYGGCNLSTDGRCCAVADEGGRIHITDTVTGKVLAAYKNNACSVAMPGRLFFTPDGMGLITIGADDRMTFWDLAKSGREPRWSFSERMLNSPKKTTHVVVGQRLLAASESNGSILIVDLASGRHLARLNDRSDDFVTAMAFSSNGAWLASTEQGKTIAIWNIQHHTRERELIGSDAIVDSLRFSRNGDFLCSVCRADVTKLWDFSPKSTSLISEHQSTVMDVRFVADGHELVCSDGTGLIESYDVRSNEKGLSLSAHAGPVPGIAISPDSAQLASIGHDGMLRFWHRKTGQLIAEQTLSAHDALCDVSWSPDGRTVAVASEDHVVYLLDPDNRTPARQLHGHTLGVATVAFSADGRLLASGGREGKLILWDVATARVTYKLQAGATTVHAVAFSPLGPTLASGGDDRKIKIWDAASGRCLRTLEGHKQDVCALCVSPDGQMLASGDRSGVIILWDIESGRDLIKIVRHTDMVFTLAFSPDGRQLASGGRDRTLRLHDLSYFDRHIAGNMEYQIVHADEQGLDPGLVAERRIWAKDLWQSRWETSSGNDARLEVKRVGPNEDASE